MIRRSLAAALFLAAAATCSAETADELIARVSEKAKALKSYQYKTTSTSKSAGVNMTSTSTNSFLRDGENYLMRMETSSKMEMQGMPAQESSTTVVNDGKFVWSEMKQMGQTMVSKSPVTPESKDPASGLKTIAQMGKATVKAPAEVDGRKCSVLEVAMANPVDASQPGAVSTYYIDDATGLMLKMDSKMGDMTTTMTVSEFKTDVSLDKAKFSYAPPEGVPVTEVK